MSQIYFIGVTFYMIRTVFPSINRSTATVHTATGICQRDTADSSRSICLAYACCSMHSL